jgi:hypothetical protein
MLRLRALSSASIIVLGSAIKVCSTVRGGREAAVAAGRERPASEPATP